MTGSTEAARSAGIRLAAAATITKSTEHPAKINSSPALTPKSKFLNNGIKKKAAKSPRIIPLSASIIASRITRASIPVREEPSAIRIPISFVRWVTE